MTTTGAPVGSDASESDADRLGVGDVVVAAPHRLASPSDQDEREGSDDEGRVLRGRGGGGSVALDGRMDVPFGWAVS